MALSVSGILDATFSFFGLMPIVVIAAAVFVNKYR